MIQCQQPFIGGDILKKIKRIILVHLAKKIHATCTNISFQLYSLVSPYTHFKLYPQNPCQNLFKGLRLIIEALPCPLGFALSDKDLIHVCACDKKLRRFAQNCNIGTNSIKRVKNNFWIFKQSDEMLLLHEYRCPLDYCINAPVNVTLDDPSVQCDFNRHGTLCGKCQKGFSLAFGSLHCIHCTNNRTALIILFAVAGIVLIALIFLARLTVSVGTLNGLFFYANIIQANHQAYFPRDTINFFTTFISWLNLDLGMETCFYDGMDIYAYSWFQFLFPFYLWFLVGCIILASHYSRSIA